MNKLYISFLAVSLATLIGLVVYVDKQRAISKPLPVVIYESGKIPHIPMGEFMLTFYCNPQGNRTASGTETKACRTIAVDKQHFSFGDYIYVDGFGMFVAEDTGGLIKGKRLDIFVKDCEEARQLGVKYAKVMKVDR